jgi:hypothetical protein
MKERTTNMKTWNYIDKTGWGHGDWTDEPDKVQWTDDATGLVCLTVRSPGGHWYGYVGVTEGHPFFGVDYTDTYGKADIDVHGGLVYSDFRQERDDEHGICHTPEPGQPERVWWFGFDCAHRGDRSPAYSFNRGPYDEEYRRLRYVQEQCASLAGQLIKVNQPAATA